MSHSELEHVPEKIEEEMIEEFKQRQRRRSSLAAPIPKNVGRKLSTISTESFCESACIQPNAGLMLAQRRRRLPNIKPASYPGKFEGLN